MEIYQLLIVFLHSQSVLSKATDGYN